MTKYTESDLDIIRKNYLNLPYRELGEMLGNRSAANISGKIQKMGLDSKICKIMSKRKTKSYNAYSSWSSMMKRCYNPNRDGWKNYGGRGITVCKEWQESFFRFLEDMGERPPGYSIDRINPDGNYTKENCRWIPMAEQGKTTRIYLNRKPCVDCGCVDGARRNGRCHKCGEYFRRHGVQRPPIENLHDFNRRPLMCPKCGRVSTKRVHGDCVKCYRAKWARDERKRKHNELQP